MQFQIARDKRGTPSFDGVLERINVILGTNGSGKSKLLNALELSTKLQNEHAFEVVRVTASRREDLPPTFSITTNTGKSYGDFDEEVKQDFEFSPMGVPNESETRLQQALNHFSTSLGSEKVEYRKRHYEWMAMGGQTAPPAAPKDRDAEKHLDKLLSLFNEIFPEIRIKAKNFQYNEEPFVKPEGRSTVGCSGQNI